MADMGLCLQTGGLRGPGGDGPSWTRATGSRGSGGPQRQLCHRWAHPCHHPKSHWEPPQAPGLWRLPDTEVWQPKQFIMLVYILPLFFQLNAGEPAVDWSKSTRLRKLVLFLSRFFL